MMDMGLLDQWDAAKRNPGAAAFGGVIGGILPIGGYRTSHYDISLGKILALDPQTLVLLPVLAACLLFSVTTVWQWGRASSREKWKSVWLVIGLEGLMIASPAWWLSLLSLLILISINAVTTACILVSQRAPRVESVAEVAAKQRITRAAAARVVDSRLAPRPT